ncbi:MAG TPA: sigma factor [Acidimicrobiia bacterium]|nr:sigma factor [Acidimicrobiia bacterium]
MTLQPDNRSRFEAIWREHRHQIMAYCLRRASSADADDACAETFLVVWRRIDDIPPAPKTLLCLYGIARKVLSNQTRTFTEGGGFTPNSPTWAWRLSLTRCMSS